MGFWLHLYNVSICNCTNPNVGSHYMRQIILTILVFGSTITTWGQVRGEILINGRKLEIPTDKPDHFSFKISTTSLDDSGKTYLNYFGETYKNKFQPTDTLVVLLDPASTKEEQEIVNNKIGFKRATTVTKYLDKKFDIKITKVRLRETITVCELVGVPTRRGYKVKNIKKR